MIYKKQIEGEVEKYFVRAEKFYGRVFPRLQITFGPRMTSTAGWLQSNKKGEPVELRFSVPICNDNPNVFIAEVPGHEVAHAIVSYLYPTQKTKPHGPEWKEVMKVFELEPSVTHSMKTKSARSFLYRNGEETFRLGIRQHNKLQRGHLVAYTSRKSDALIKKEHFICETS